jgi:hypothetical protein
MEGEHELTALAADVESQDEREFKSEDDRVNASGHVQELERNFVCTRKLSPEILPQLNGSTEFPQYVCHSHRYRELLEYHWRYNSPRYLQWRTSRIHLRIYRCEYSISFCHGEFG